LRKSVIVVTGCDAAFYPFLDEALKSLVALNVDQRADIGILDLGLSSEQISLLQTVGYTIRKPTWAIDVPEDIKSDRQLGLVARTALRDYFPGFEIYIWFDADAWAQTPEFLDQLIMGVKAKQAAIIRENGSGYRRSWHYNRWWYGHMVATYGPIDGVMQAAKPAVNIGIMALSDTAPHWQGWVRHYKRFIDKRRRVNLDQHAFNAALDFEDLPYALVPARCNWICTLSTPVWDSERNMFCEPNEAATPLSVLHLAGPNKRRAYRIKEMSGGIVDMPLTYDTLMPLHV
jgi:hypothetical protein